MEVIKKELHVAYSEVVWSMAEMYEEGQLSRDDAVNVVTRIFGLSREPEEDRDQVMFDIESAIKIVHLQRKNGGD